MQIRLTDAFFRALDEALKHYPLSKANIQDSVPSFLLSEYKNGDVCTGFPNFEIRKLRFPLKEYKIGKRKGLRIVCMLLEGQIIPLNAYSKMEKKSEAERIKQTKLVLKEVLAELNE